MTSSLNEKLSTFDQLTKLDMIRELDSLLDLPSTVSISWTGCRRVSIQGHSRDADMNEIADKFLQAIPCSKVNPDPSFERVRAKLRVLCNEDTSLKNLYIYKYLVPMKESVFQNSRETFLFIDGPSSLSLNNPQNRCAILDVLNYK